MCQEISLVEVLLFTEIINIIQFKYFFFNKII